MKTEASLAGLAAAAAVRAPATAAAAAGQAVEPGADGVDLLAREVRRQVGEFLDAHLAEGLGVVERRHPLEAGRVASRRRNNFVRVVDLNVDAVLASQRREGVADALWRRCRADRAEDGLLLLKAVAERWLWMLRLLVMVMVAAMVLVLVVLVEVLVAVMTMMQGFS